jgi:hypothetical protein
MQLPTKEQRMQLMLDMFNGGKPTAVSQMDLPAAEPPGYPKPPIKQIGAVHTVPLKEGLEPEAYHQRQVDKEYDAFKRTFVSLFPLIQYVKAEQYEPALIQTNLDQDVLHSIARCMVEVYPKDKKFGDCQAPYRAILKNWITQDQNNHKLLTQAAFLTYLALLDKNKHNDQDDTLKYRLADKAGRAVFDLFVHEYIVTHEHMLGLTSVECLSQMSWEQENFYVQIINTAWEWIKDCDRYAVNKVIAQEDRRDFMVIDPPVSTQVLAQAGVPIQELQQTEILHEFVNTQSPVKTVGHYNLYGVQVGITSKLEQSSPSTGAQMNPNQHFQTFTPANTAAPHGFNPAPAPAVRHMHAWGSPGQTQQTQQQVYMDQYQRPCYLINGQLIPVQSQQMQPQQPQQTQDLSQQRISFLLDSNRQQISAMIPEHIQYAGQIINQGGVVYGIAGSQLVPVQVVGHAPPNPATGEMAKWVVSAPTFLYLQDQQPGMQQTAMAMQQQRSNPMATALPVGNIQDTRSKISGRPLFHIIDPNHQQHEQPVRQEAPLSSVYADIESRRVPDSLLPPGLRGRGFRVIMPKARVEAKEREILLQREEQAKEQKRLEQQAQEAEAERKRKEKEQDDEGTAFMAREATRRMAEQQAKVAKSVPNPYLAMQLQRETAAKQEQQKQSQELPKPYTSVIAKRAVEAFDQKEPIKFSEAPAPVQPKVEPKRIQVQVRKRREENYTYPMANELTDAIPMVPSANPFENMEVVEFGDDDKAMEVFLENLSSGDRAVYAASKRDYSTHHEAAIVDSLTQLDDEDKVIPMPGTPYVEVFNIDPEEEDDQGLVSDVPFAEPKQVAEAVIVSSVMSHDEAWLTSETKLYTQAPWQDEPIVEDEYTDKPYEAVMVACNHMTPILSDRDATELMETLLKNRDFKSLAAALNREYSNIVNKSTRGALSKARVWTLKTVSHIDQLFTKEINRLLKKRFGLTLTIERFSEDGHEIISYLEKNHGEKFSLALQAIQTDVIDSILSNNPDEKGTQDLTDFYYGEAFVGLSKSSTPAVTYVSRRNLYVSLRATQTYLGATLDSNGVARALIKDPDTGIVGSDVLNALVRQLDNYFEGQDFNSYENVFVRTLDGCVVSLTKNLLDRKVWMIGSVN